MSYRILSRDQHFQEPGPKRILALDGGGLRGILTLGYLKQIETLLRERHGDDAGFRLCHYFDLIAGTSTGAIIAAALASGWTVDELTKTYFELGRGIFEKSIFRKGGLRAKYAAGPLIQKLKELLGESTTMGGKELKTGLLIVTKRLDSGSPWPIGNNPRGKYFGTSPVSKAIANADYPLWQVVRASTAAPTYFEHEELQIVAAPGKDRVVGTFVDGGVSPFNNPALQALMYATLDGYRVGWATGADKLLLVSVGTGSRDPKVKPSLIVAGEGIQALAALMDDCAALMETMLQWMSTSSTARLIDRELGDLRNDRLGDRPLLTYLRYNAQLTPDFVGALEPGLTAKQIEDLSEMDAPHNMEVLHDLGSKDAQRAIRGEDFPSCFDLA